MTVFTTADGAQAHLHCDYCLDWKRNIECVDVETAVEIAREHKKSEEHVKSWNKRLNNPDKRLPDE